MLTLTKSFIKHFRDILNQKLLTLDALDPLRDCVIGL